MKNPELQTSPEVNRAVEREERKTEERVPNDPSERIDAYVERLENIFLNPDEKKRERNFEMFRDKIYDALIIKKVSPSHTLNSSSVLPVNVDRRWKRYQKTFESR